MTSRRAATTAATITKRCAFGGSAAEPWYPRGQVATRARWWEDLRNNVLAERITKPEDLDWLKEKYAPPEVLGPILKRQIALVTKTPLQEGQWVEKDKEIVSALEKIFEELVEWADPSTVPGISDSTLPLIDWLKRNVEDLDDAQLERKLGKIKKRLRDLDQQRGPRPGEIIHVEPDTKLYWSQLIASYMAVVGEIKETITSDGELNAWKRRLAELRRKDAKQRFRPGDLGFVEMKALEKFLEVWEKLTSP